MPKRKVYERVEHEGVTYLLLHKEATLKKFELQFMKTEGDLTRVMQLYKSYLDLAKNWYWVETGYRLYVFPFEDGHIWALDDKQEAVRKYVWLRNKALRFEAKIADRINEVMKGSTDGLSPASK